MAKVPGTQCDEVGVSLRLPIAQYRALLATARGEVYRTRNSITFTITGPCSSVLLWKLARVELIADPLGAEHHGRHQTELTARNRFAKAALALAWRLALDQDIFSYLGNRCFFLQKLALSEPTDRME